MKFCQSLLVVISTAMLMSCQNLPDDLPDYDELLRASTKQDGRVCIRADRINGYGILDTTVVSVDSRGRQYYLVTTLQRCNSIDTSFTAAFKSSFSEFCAIRDSIITSEERCAVKSIFEFETREEAFEAFKQARDKRNQIIEEFRNKQP